jgi:FkbM family methyltransferase
MARHSRLGHGSEPSLLGRIAHVASAARHVVLGHRTINRGGRGAVNVIDVGSAGGLPPAWKNQAYRIRHLLNFEPLEASSGQGTVTTVGAALWRTAEERPFYIYRGGQYGNSLFRQNVDFVRAHFSELKERGDPALAATWFERSETVATRTIRTTTLDAVLGELRNGVRYDFIKLDTQGADLPILEGATGFLANDCIAIQLEAFEIPLLVGVPLLDDCDAYLESRGFDRAYTADPHGTFDSQRDVLYLRRGVGDSAVLDSIRAVYGLR